MLALPLVYYCHVGGDITDFPYFLTVPFGFLYIGLDLKGSCLMLVPIPCISFTHVWLGAANQ